MSQDLPPPPRRSVGDNFFTPSSRPVLAEVPRPSTGLPVAPRSQFFDASRGRTVRYDVGRPGYMDATPETGPSYSVLSPLKRDTPPAEGLRGSMRSSVQFGTPMLGHKLEGETPAGVPRHEHVEPVVRLGAVAAAEGEELSDEDLFSEILFLWLGPESTKSFKYNDVDKRYVMEAGSTRQKSIFELFQECGVFARQIDQIVNARSSSFLQQSLKSAVRRQMNLYHQFIGGLRSAGPMTLAGLKNAWYKVHSKLFLMHKILLDTESAKGGELVTKLQGLNNQGSRRMSDLLSDIYIEAVSPLLQMTVRWITLGESPDPYAEFFVRNSDKVRDNDEGFWLKKYSLVTEMLPVTFCGPIAHDILNVIKNINFIRRCCRAKDWRLDPGIVVAAQNATFDSIRGVLSRALECSNQAAIRVVIQDHKLKRVLALIRSLFLVANGDLFENLIARLDGILSKPSLQVQSASVREQVQNAFNTTSFFQSDVETDLLSQVDAYIEKKENTTGWDGFILTLNIYAPLNNIIDRRAMETYKALFSLFLKVKRGEVSLKQAWRQSVFLDRMVARHGNAAHREVSRDAHLLGLELSHFVNNLQSYFVAEVTVAAWEKLQTSLDVCKCFDDIRSTHTQYLQQLEMFSLLHRDASDILQLITNILDLTRLFCVAHSNLMNFVNRKLGDIHSIKQQYQHIADEYHKLIRELMTLLEEQHLQYDFMNFLLLRLNFNQFYHDTQSGNNTEF